MQVLVAIMTANNEVGAVHDMASVVAAVKATNPQALVFTDASQAVGKIPVDVTASQVFCLRCKSGHSQAYAYAYLFSCHS